MRKSMDLSEFIKAALMTPLQQQLAEKGRCPHCKSKLRYAHTGAEMDFHQCRKCLRVYVLPEKPKLIG